MGPFWGVRANGRRAGPVGGGGARTPSGGGLPPPPVPSSGPVRGFGMGPVDHRSRARHRSPTARAPRKPPCRRAHVMCTADRNGGGGGLGRSPRPTGRPPPLPPKPARVALRPPGGVLPCHTATTARPLTSGAEGRASGPAAQGPGPRNALGARQRRRRVRLRRGGPGVRALRWLCLWPWALRVRRSGEAGVPGDAWQRRGPVRLDDCGGASADPGWGTYLFTGSGSPGFCSAM